MAFHHLNTLRDEGIDIEVELIVGMCARDGLGKAHHEGFKRLVEDEFKGRLKCSYLMKNPPVHSKVYCWIKNDEPVIGYSGSANYTQMAFIGKQRELLTETDSSLCYDYFDTLCDETIYCDNIDVESLVQITSDLAVERRKGQLRIEDDPAMLEIHQMMGLDSVRLSLLDRNGNLPKKSGLNWGQRPEYRREPNQAYIKVPAYIGKSDFFPVEKQHFTILTDDEMTIVCTIAQANRKAIESPHNNSLIGKYFRKRLGLKNGEFVRLEHLMRYGRTDVEITKIDDETYYMDFSV